MSFITRSLLLNPNNESIVTGNIQVSPDVKQITCVGAFCDTGATNNYIIYSDLVHNEIVGMYDGTNQRFQKLDLDYDYSQNPQRVSGTYTFRFVDFQNAVLAVTGGVVLMFKFHY